MSGERLVITGTSAANGIDLLYHSGSIDPGGASARALGGRYYERDVDGYTDALLYTFDINDYRGRVLVDIGSGKCGNFAHDARKAGVNVVSINPALLEREHRNTLKIQLDRLHRIELERHEEHSTNRTRFERLFWPNRPGPVPILGNPNSLAALGQQLPLADRCADAVVSVFGVPQYLHHIDPAMRESATTQTEIDAADTAILQAYTPDIRELDKTAIKQAFAEILRILTPGGKAFLADTHCTPGQTKNINPYSPSDGTEVIEALQELSAHFPLAYKVLEQTLDDGNMHRVIVLAKY